MQNSAKNEMLKGLFATHPKVDKFYFTSDGQAFIEKHHADNHGKTLEDKAVSNISRVLFEAVEKAKEEKFGKQPENGEAASGKTETGLELPNEDNSKTETAPEGQPSTTTEPMAPVEEVQSGVESETAPEEQTSTSPEPAAPLEVAQPVTAPEVPVKKERKPRASKKSTTTTESAQ